MKILNDFRWADAAVFLLLVAIGVVGRWGQPDWCITPLAAVGLLAGYHFRKAGVAVATPIAAMAVSDLALPVYSSPWVMVAVYASMAAAPLLGRLMRRPLPSRGAGFARLAACAAAPSLVFFFATNTVHWLAMSDYPKSPAGLAECYAMAVPFLRRMATGDAVYTAVLFAAAASVGAFSLTGRGGASAAPQAEAA